ncbi:nuclear transport factor 2 family protein [Streptomyces sp. cg40]|uniref:nuclear transport factor 2 family protein n=1 Tax=Streptomyces sp. cg40 TaxID=3419764 RepID=UPI003D04DC49
MTQLSVSEVAAVRDELARAEIRDALFRYCRGVDRADEDLIRSAYHPDAHDRHGRYDGPSHAFATAHVARMPSTAEGIQHLLGNMLIELDGDSARVETYFIAAYRPKADLDVVAMFGGRYLDLFERRGGPWLIANRTVVNDWTFRHPLPRDTAGDAGYPRGRSDIEDLVFHAATWAVPLPADTAKAQP